MSKYNFSFGDSYAVAAALKEQFGHLATSVVNFHPTYPPVHGFEALNKRTSNLIKDLTGTEYKHVLITHGATGALNLLLRAWEGPAESGVVTDDHYFIFYPHMIGRANLTHYTAKDRKKGLDRYELRLTALPSNPTGSVERAEAPGDRTIWDACYFSPVYMNTRLAPQSYIPPHRAMVGSFGKLLGLNGSRVGWIATEDSELYERLVWDQVADTMGGSTLGMALVDNILGEGERDPLQMQGFMAKARAKLNHNREALRRLERFGSAPVPENGMFWFTAMDERALGLLAKAGVQAVDGRQCGGGEGSVRLTLGQTPELTGEMVRAVLAADRRRR